MTPSRRGRRKPSPRTNGRAGEGRGGEGEELSSQRSYRTQRRGGKGLHDIKTTDRNGPVIGVVRVSDDDELLMMTARGKLQRIRAADVSIIGRNTQGVKIMSLDEDDALVAVSRCRRKKASGRRTRGRDKSPRSCFALRFRLSPSTIRPPPFSRLTRIGYRCTLSGEARPMDQSQCPCPSSAAVQTLRRQIARIETLRRRPDEPPVSSGCPPLDGILPEGGFHRGTLTEWLADGDGAGATTLAVLAAREACRQGGTLVVVDADGGFYPPAAVRLGIARGNCVVRAEQRADHDWALDQALRCPAVAAVLAWPESPAGALTTGPSGGCNWPPRRAGVWVCSCGRPSRGMALPGPTCGCWSSRSRPNRIAAACGSCSCGVAAAAKAAVSK